MAESLVQVTEGSGKKLHTWQRTIGANNVEDEFTLPSEYPYATYTVLSSSASTATSADHLLQLMAGSSLNVRIRYIRVQQVANATTATLATIDVLRLTTAGSGGTTATPARHDTSAAASGATGMKLPTSKGTESTLILRNSLILRQAILATSAQTDGILEWRQSPNGGPIIIPAGTSNGIAVQIVTGIAGATVNVMIEFVETAF